MRAILLGLALCASVPALAQSGPPGGGGPGGPGGPGGGGGPGGPPPGAMRPPRPMKPIQREQLDKPIAAMFQIADRNQDGLVSLEELRMVIEERREVRIRERFKRIDANHDRSISEAEFLAWQHGMGSVASSEQQSVADIGGLVSEAIVPDLPENERGAALAIVIEPLNAMTIVNANTNYDAGISLDELLAYQRKRFDRADADGDGQLTMREARSLDPNRRPDFPGPGFPPGGAMPPPGGPMPPRGGND